MSYKWNFVIYLWSFLEYSFWICSLHVSVIYSLSFLSSFPLCRFVAFCWSVHLRENILSISGYHWWWIKLLWTFLCQSYYGHMFLVSHWVKCMFSFVRNYQTRFQVAVPFCIPTTSLWEFYLPQVLTWYDQFTIISTEYVLVYSYGVTLNFSSKNDWNIWGLICLFLVCIEA